jgi:hypothetical protein
MSIKPMSGEAGTHEPDNLIAGEFPIAVVDGVISEGEGNVFSRGTILGRKGDGEWTISTGGATDDGSEVPRGVLLVDVDASDDDIVAPIARTGDFNERAVTIGDDHTADGIREGLADLNIYLRTTVSA